MSTSIAFSDEARRMLDEADERWIGEHGLGDNPLLDEVDHAAELLRTTPELGIPYGRDRFRRDVRRLLLRSGWHLYYAFDAKLDLVVIVAVWFAGRGTVPRL